MIQNWIEEQIADLLNIKSASADPFEKFYPKEEKPELFKGFKSTVNYFTEENDTVTVYSSAGLPPSDYDLNYLYPGYQIWIRSEDWDLAELAANMIFDLFHKYPRTEQQRLDSLNVETTFEEFDEVKKEYIVLKTKEHQVFSIIAASNPIRIGESNGKMEYSVNFDVTLKNKGEQ